MTSNNKTVAFWELEIHFTLISLNMDNVKLVHEPLFDSVKSDLLPQ